MSNCGKVLATKPEFTSQSYTEEEETQFLLWKHHDICMSTHTHTLPFNIKN